MKLSKILLGFMVVMGVAQAKLTAEFQAMPGNTEAELAAMIKNMGSVGYSTVAANTHIENFYYQKFQEKGVEMISFFALVNKERLRTLLLANPDFGAYAPYNFLVYKTLDKKNDDFTWYGHLAADTMLDIIGEHRAEQRKEFTDMVNVWDDYVNKTVKATKTRKFEHTKPLPEHGLIKMVMKFDEPDDLEEFVEDFVAKHDGQFSTNNFIIAGFIDFKFEYEDRNKDFSKYDAYWVSLLCHFKFSNSIFNRGKPYAGMFAPCSVYFYIPKGKNELHVGYASVDNWINALDFTDEARIKYMRQIDAEVVETFKQLGFELEKQ